MVMGDDSCSKGRGFESRRRILDGHFFTLICCKNCNNVCLKKTENKQKRGRGWPILKKKQFSYMGSGCNSVGRAVVSDYRGPRFESSHWQKFILNIHCQMY